LRIRKGNIGHPFAAFEDIASALRDAPEEQLPPQRASLSPGRLL